MLEAERKLCRLLWSFIVCMVIYEVFGRNLDVVKAALSVKDPNMNISQLIASAYSLADVTTTFMSGFLNVCIKYENETVANQKIICLDNVQSYFG